jgi:hypothetical protein
MKTQIVTCDINDIEVTSKWTYDSPQWGWCLDSDSLQCDKLCKNLKRHV